VSGSPNPEAREKGFSEREEKVNATSTRRKTSKQWALELHSIGYLSEAVQEASEHQAITFLLW
jgi:hypothetical protein